MPSLIPSTLLNSTKSIIKVIYCITLDFIIPLEPLQNFPKSVKLLALERAQIKTGHRRRCRRLGSGSFQIWSSSDPHAMEPGCINLPAQMWDKVHGVLPSRDSCPGFSVQRLCWSLITETRLLDSMPHGHWAQRFQAHWYYTNKPLPQFTPLIFTAWPTPTEMRPTLRRRFLIYLEQRIRETSPHVLWKRSPPRRPIKSLCSMPTFLHACGYSMVLFLENVTWNAGS